MRKKSNVGFTLIELIVVIAIIAILALIIIPVVSGYVERAEKTGVEANARALYSSVSFAITDDKDIVDILKSYVKSGDVVFYSLDDEGHLEHIRYVGKKHSSIASGKSLDLDDRFVNLSSSLTINGIKELKVVKP